MKKGDNLYNSYIDILKEELIPAMGCTEPIAIAYAAALARKTLNTIPEKIDIAVSGNIIKNVKSVIVPHTGGLRGIPAAVAAGIIAGDADSKLEVLSNVTEDKVNEIPFYLDKNCINITLAHTPHIFDIMITAYSGNDTVFVRLVDKHTNLVTIKRNDVVLFNNPVVAPIVKQTDRSILSIENIVNFADIVNTEDVSAIISRQIDFNMAIAEEGLTNNYGANIGKVLLHGNENDLSRKMRAYAAAGSDARMNGCEMPVIINSGSGNQGITTSVPVIVYAREKNFPKEKLIKALCVANLVTIHLKTGIGSLSAYCGVVSAGCGAAAGVAWLEDGGYDSVAHTIVNGLAMNSGILCDGAKASCAAKISSAVDAAFLGLSMYQQGNQFYSGDGLVRKGVEHNIAAVSHIAKAGMSQTDKEIIKLMLEEY